MTQETQAAFARRRGVSKQRIAQYIRNGQIDGDALIHASGKMSINVDLAEAQLASRLDTMRAMDQKIGTARKFCPAEVAAPQTPITASLEDALATIVAEAPSNAAWAALSLGIEPWRALAIFETTKMDIIGETRLTFGIELDVSSFETVNWSSALAEYRPGEVVDVPAWRAQIASFEAAQEAAEKKNSPEKLAKRAAAAVR